MAELPAEAALESFLALMMAAPLCWTVGMKSLLTQLLSTREGAGLPRMWIEHKKSYNEKLTLNGGVVDIRVHSGRVVTPDGEVVNIADVGVGLFGQLVEGSVVVQSGHGSEVFLGDVLGIMGSDQAVGVSGVTDNQDLDVSAGVVVDGSTGIDEDLTVVLQEVTSFHTGSSGLSTDEEGIVGVLETNRVLVTADNAVQEGESAIVEFHGNTVEGTSGGGDIEQLEDDGLVLAQHVTVGNSEDGGITNVTSSTSDSDSDGGFLGEGLGKELGEEGVRGRYRSFW